MRIIIETTDSCTATIEQLLIAALLKLEDVNGDNQLMDGSVPLSINGEIQGFLNVEENGT